MMQIGSKGLELIKEKEGFIPFVYDDKISPAKEWKGEIVKGTLTIGIGHTNSALHPLKIEKGLRITEKKALEILDVDLDECEKAVNSLVKVPLTQGQFDALCSFAFNCGVGNLKKLIIPLNKGNYVACCAKFGEFIRSKGQIMGGLVNRRKAEQALFNDPYNVKIPEEEVQAVPKVTSQDAPTVTGKIIESTTVWAGLGTFIATIAAAITDWKIMAVIATAILLGYIAYNKANHA